MSFQSKKVLFTKTIPQFIQEHINEFPRLENDFLDIEVEGLKHNTINNETYGSKSMIYIKFGTLEIRHAFELFIESSEEFSFKVNKNYDPDNNFTEVQVSYFKGYGWDF